METKKVTKTEETPKRNIDERVDLTASFDIEKQAKLDYGEIEVVVSNSAVDRYGESITMEGIDTTQVKRNPVVLWGHDYFGLPIGKITKLWKSAGNLMARIKFATDIYDFAETVYKLVMDGVVNAVSIGGIVKQWNDSFDTVEKLEMVELSVVAVGAHPDALVTAKSLGMEPTTFKKQYEEFVYKSLIDKNGKLPHNEIRLQIEVLKNLTSALESAYSDSTDSENNPLVRKKKLIVVRSTAKQCDKQAELIIAAINKSIKF